MKDIKDYLHLYLGCKVRLNNRAWTGKLVGIQNHGTKEDVLIEFPFNLTPDEDWAEYTRDYKFKEFKLLLRPLSDMTEEERMWFFNSLRRKHEGLDYSEWITEYNGNPVEPHWVLWVKDQRTKHGYTIGINNHFKSEEFHWLLSKGFDLFGLIEAGLAIDRATLKQKV